MARQIKTVGQMKSDPDAAAQQVRLDELRDRIIAVDDEIIRLIGERRDLVLEIGRNKESLGLPILDPAREARVVRRVAERSRALGVDEELARDVIWRILSSSRQTQSQQSSSDPPPIVEFHTQTVRGIDCVGLVFVAFAYLRQHGLRVFFETSVYFAACRIFCDALSNELRQ